MMKKFIENYLLEKEVGTGEFGLVFKSINITNNKEYAIK
jgi:hypothetical protein